ncbi:MAG: 2-polyprenyl-6-methoxyphenol hydroxylase-like FAD-dependent oxidoreductase [Verrucomicrobiales bacterium]|jgi:2-polyprenyl-6-methoxyphenol hydroxylase-like FAD-dependent oxidoreductase
MNPLRIAIVGCGTTGPAAALLLARSGHEVEIFEQAPDCKPVGAGFLLQPSGMSVLAELGILDEVIDHGSKVRWLFCQTVEGRTLLDLHYEEIAKNAFGAGLHRSVLLSILLRELDAAGIPVRWDSPVDAVDGDRLVVRGERRGPFDLILLADGANSRVRDSTGISGKANRYPWGAIWWIGQDRANQFDESELNQVVDGTGKMLGFLPTGRAFGRNETEFSLFWSFRLADRERWLATPIDLWKQQLLALMPKAEAFLEPIESHDQLTIASYLDVRYRRWHTKNLALLGDCGHAMSPQLGQGVNLGLLDARTLVECLDSAKSLPRALAAYTKRRRASLRYYQFATRWLTPFFQSNHEWLTPLRDFGFPILNRIPPARRQMIETMMGLRQNALFSDLQLLASVDFSA